ncbi:hypothetical protein GCM10020000_80790 [Streptomyces olivoverticillatus]
MGMQEKRNPLKLVLAAAATGAALLVPAMPSQRRPDRRHTARCALRVLLPEHAARVVS